MNKIKPEVGQTLYSLNVGNSARNKVQELTPVIVSKVGRKYFTCTPDGWKHGTEYYLDDWSEKTEYSASSVLYASIEEWEEEKEKNKLYSAVKDVFNGYCRNRNLTIGQLREISKILGLDI